ncbi:glycosyl hydrolase [Candidatus Poriferisodalis sp.]|uniref:glycosyl hydrolase n=1 Tax=Candidatus Poriferisodalis sp. TaxID=3101277 RepID=UPI003B02AEF7
MTDSTANDPRVPARIAGLASEALEVAQAKVGNLIQNHPGFFPLYTMQGRWAHDMPAWTNWCEGFLGGQLWIFAEQTGENFWHEAAERYSLALRGRQFDRSVHDLGFTFWPTWKRWHRLTGDPALEAVVVQAGRTMGLRFNDKAGFLRSFLAEDSTFIDIMMNVGIIQYAADVSDDERLGAIAETHCLNTRRHLVRGDGSAAHEGIFDLETGEFLRQSTQQGWRSDSTWARGQAWALYGFGTMYSLTGLPAYLNTARACADFFIARTDAGGVPPNDWDEPSPSVPFESSAAAIATSGLLQLSELVEPEDSEAAEAYRTHAFDTVETLCGPEFLASQDPEWGGVLKHGSYHERHGYGVDESVMWGEYFFVETLDKCLGGRWLSKDA